MALLCKNIFLIPGIVLIFQSRVFSQKIKVLPNANRTSSLGTFSIKNLQESNKKGRFIGLRFLAIELIFFS